MNTLEQYYNPIAALPKLQFFEVVALIRVIHERAARADKLSGKTNLMVKKLLLEVAVYRYNRILYNQLEFGSGNPLFRSPERVLELIIEPEWIPLVEEALDEHTNGRDREAKPV